MRVISRKRVEMICFKKRWKFQFLYGFSSFGTENFWEYARFWDRSIQYLSKTTFYCNLICNIFQTYQKILKLFLRCLRLREHELMTIFLPQEPSAWILSVRDVTEKQLSKKSSTFHMPFWKNHTFWFIEKRHFLDYIDAFLILY